MGRVVVARPSAGHPNRRLYNRLAYDLGDEAIRSVESNFRGVLVDLGCGTAPYRDYLGGFVDRYIGVDWSSSFHGIQADLIADLSRPLPLADGMADSVLSLSVLEHLPEPELMLRESYRILRPGGRIVLMVPFMWGVHEAPYDYFRFTRHGLSHLFGKAGFRDVEVHEVTGFWATWVLKFNYQSRKLIRGPRAVRAIWIAALSVVWWVNQVLARQLDRYWDGREETQSYLVTATHP